MAFSTRLHKTQHLILTATLGLAALSFTARAVVPPPQAEDDWGTPDSAKKMKNPVSPATANLAAAKSVYADNCARCHGVAGKGDGPDADRYDPSPTNFTDVKIMQAMSEGKIYWKLSEGRLPMPAFKAILGDQKRWQLVNYLRTLSKSAPAAK